MCYNSLLLKNFKEIVINEKCRFKSVIENLKN